MLLIVKLFSQTQILEDSPFVDLTSLCFNLARESDDTDVVAAARGLGQFLIGSPAQLVGWEQRFEAAPSSMTSSGTDRHNA